MTQTKPLEGLTALVTGASRGIGRAIAFSLARAGAHVIAQGRVVGALEELDDDIRKIGGTATLLPLDLHKTADIDGLGPSLLQRHDCLDIFIANAGILGPLTPLGHVTPKNWDDVIAVNLTANWRLIRTLDPLLRRSQSGRVVFVSSGASSGKYPYWGPYAVSKAGLQALAHTYAREVEKTNMRINIVNPGGTRTQMRAKGFPGEDPNTLPTPEDIAPLFVALSSPDCDLNGEVIEARQWLEQHAKADTK